MMYASRIQVKREPQKVRYHREIKLNNDGVLTLAELRNLVTEDERFSVIEKENSIYGSSYILSISGERLETEEEVAARIEREERYNENYEKFHAKKN